MWSHTLEHERDVVVDEQHAGAGVGDGADALAEPLALARCRGRPPARRAAAPSGSARTGPGDRHELALALAEVAGRPVAELADARPARAPRSTGRGALAAAGAERGGADVLLDGQVVVELERLERAGQAACAPGRAAASPSIGSPSSVDVRRRRGRSR